MTTCNLFYFVAKYQNLLWHFDEIKSHKQVKSVRNRIKNCKNAYCIQQRSISQMMVNLYWHKCNNCVYFQTFFPDIFKEKSPHILPTI